MYIVNGIAYAGESCNEIEVEEVLALDDMMLLITFNSGEKRLYDATKLLEYQAFKPLKIEEVFKSARVEHGVVVWLNGELDIAPEALYKNSYSYQEANIFCGS
ncbi:MAG: DUF2442 domain-containing protein [Defluviitaleaceae bacterium]|nr:DUF2442 domain-containing protein [Defluviitaleaceae bacterium]